MILSVRRIPLLIPVVSLAVGIIAFVLLQLPWWWILIMLGLTIVFFFTKFIYAGISFASLLIGFIVAYMSSSNFNPLLFNDNGILFTGCVTQVSETEIGDRYIVALKSAYREDKTYKIRNSKVILNTFEFMTDIKPYDIVSFRAEIKDTDYNPELPGDTDYTNYYRYNSIIGTGFVEPDGITVLSSDYSFGAILYQWRARTSEVLEQSGISYDNYQLLNAVLLGDIEKLPANEHQLFADAGLAHLLALSGTHVAIICSFIFFLLMPLRAFGYRNYVYVACIVVIWVYAFLSGMSASVVRAAVMISVLFLARLTGRSSNNFNSLCFAAILILVFDPMAIFSPSFQLSFSAVLSILLFYDVLRRNKNNRPVLRYIIGIVYVALAALIGTSLLSAYYFHKFPVYSLISNLPCVILLPPFLISGIILICLGFLGITWNFAADISDWLYEAMAGIASFFSELPGSIIENIYFTPWIFIPFVAAVICLALYSRKKDRFYAYCSALLNVIVMVALLPPYNKRNQTAWYLTGNSYSTELIIESGSDVYIVSTDKSHDTRQIIDGFKRKHSGFLQSKRMKEPVILDDSRQHQRIRRKDNLIEIGNLSIAIIDSDTTGCRQFRYKKADYGLLTKSFGNGDIMEVISGLDIDTILLPKELHINHVRKLSLQLEEIGYPYYNMRENRIWRTN